MARRDKVSMPQSGGGLVRYFDDFKAKYEVKPMHMLIIIGIIIVIVLILQSYGFALLGLK